MLVRLGSVGNTTTTTDGGHQDIQIARFVSHPQYEPNMKINDIAIIQLVRDVEFSGEFII